MGGVYPRDKAAEEKGIEGGAKTRESNLGGRLWLVVDSYRQEENRSSGCCQDGKACKFQSVGSLV